MRTQDEPYLIESISEQHRLLGLPKPKHPAISVFGNHLVQYGQLKELGNFMLNFYCVTIKKDYKGKMRYGQHYYDFDEGMITFISPKQLLNKMDPGEGSYNGFTLMFHPDFIAGTSLDGRMGSFGFFSYELHEALHLSEEEEKIVEGILGNIEREYATAIDHFSQSVMIAQIELLLQYCNRFYKRQFITRKVANDGILVQLERLLQDHFSSPDLAETGPPSVRDISEQLHTSPHYLSDMLKSMTGRSTKQHIQDKLLEKAKELLSTSNKTVAEIAFTLGFEHPQSFNKLFKNKERLSPLEYRKQFH